MAYSITPILNGYKDKANLQQVQIQVIFNRKKCFISMPLKLQAAQLVNRTIVNHPFKLKLNNIISTKIHEIEGKLLESLKHSETITLSELKELCRGKQRSNDDKVNVYFEDLQNILKGKISPGRLKHYNVCKNKLNEYNQYLTWRDIDDSFPDKVERFIRNTGVNSSTLASNMAVIKATFKRAKKAKLLVADPFESYTIPKVIEGTPEYLTEDEINKFSDAVQSLTDSAHKRAGYYFLLSCYTGYRLSDSMGFDYDKSVSNDQIVLRAKKNNTLVSIPVHTRLKPVLEYVRATPVNLSEEKIREYVKTICKFAGITKHVKFHTSRHSFAMLLMAKGFSIDEVADMLGDTPAVAKTYAKISNVHLSKKILDRLG